MEIEFTFNYIKPKNLTQRQREMKKRMKHEKKTNLLKWIIKEINDAFSLAELKGELKEVKLVRVK